MTIAAAPAIVTTKEPIQSADSDSDSSNEPSKKTANLSKNVTTPQPKAAPVVASMTVSSPTAAAIHISDSGSCSEEFKPRRVTSVAKHVTSRTSQLPAASLKRNSSAMESRSDCGHCGDSSKQPLKRSNPNGTKIDTCQAKSTVTAFTTSAAKRPNVQNWLNFNTKGFKPF